MIEISEGVTGSWLMPSRPGSARGSQAGSPQGSQVAGQLLPNERQLPQAGLQSQVAGQCGVLTYHIGSEVGSVGQGPPGRRGRRGLLDQQSQSSSDLSIGPSASVAHGPPAHKQTRGGGGSAESMCTAVSRNEQNPFAYKVDVSPHQMRVWTVDRRMWETIPPVLI